MFRSYLQNWQNSCKSVCNNCSKDARFEHKASKKGQPYFVLLATNKQVIGKSEVYSSKVSMLKGIAFVKKSAPSAKIEDLSA